MRPYCFKVLDNTESILFGLFIVWPHFCSAKTASHLTGFDLRRKKEIAECSFCREAEAERCKLLLTRRKDALSGVSALVNRYYKYIEYYSIYIRDCKYSIFTNIYLKSRPESC